MPLPREDKFGVVATRHFESGPPAAIYTDDDGEVFETVQEEEVVHKKRKATTTTRNIERRTQRDLLLEDGKVVGDSGPTVTEDVTEDTQVKETFADENLKPEGQQDKALALPPGEGWVAVPGSLVTSEKIEKIVTSHQEQENTRETEQEAHYGDVTNEEVEKHKGHVGRLALAAENRRKASGGKEVVLSEPRLVSESNRNWGVVDTEDIKETSRIKDGHVVTETQRTTKQEQFDHASAPDSGSSISDGSVHEEGHRAQHHLVHTKDEDILEYYAVPKGGTLAQGVKLGEGMHVVSEDVQEDREGDALEDVGASFLRHRQAPPAAAGVVSPTPREDALTKKPLDYFREEKQRQHETSRWLEHHFGSESDRSRSSEDEKSGNLIKITMSPHPASPPPTPPQGPLRRWGNLTSTPVSAKSPPPPLTKITDSPGPPPPPMPHQINEARARLRSTGKTLDELDSQRDVNNGRVRNISYSFSQNSGSGGPFTPPTSPTSPTSFSANYSSNNKYPGREDRYERSTREDRFQTSDRSDRLLSTNREGRFVNSGRENSFLKHGREDSYSSGRENRYQVSDREDRPQSSSRIDRYISSGRDDHYQTSDRDERYHTSGRNDRYHSSSRGDRYLSSDRDDRYQNSERDDRYQNSDRDDRYQTTRREERYQSSVPGERHERSIRDDNYVGNNSSHVGRSQSFHTSNVERSSHEDYNSQTLKPRSRSPQPEAPPRQTKGKPQSAQFSTLQNPKKTDKFFKLFGKWGSKHDDSDNGSRSKSKKSNDKSGRQSRNNDDDRRKERDLKERPASTAEQDYNDNEYNNEGSTKFSAKMAGKYSDYVETPVPPPRTKRRPRPQTTYYFGQQPDNSSRSSKQRPHSIYANISYGSNKNDHDEDTRYGPRSYTNFNSDDYNGKSSDYSRSNKHVRKHEYSNGYERDSYNNKNNLEMMNSRNDYYSSNRREAQSPKINDYSSERYDSGYGDPHDNYSRQKEESPSRKSVDSRRYEEKSNRRTSEERRRNQRKSSKEDKYNKRSSPSVERKYKTTKTVTPVYVMETKQPKQYRSMDVLNSSPERNGTSWTQTLDSKKKRSDSYLQTSSTLPRKVHHTSFSTPSKTYIYGNDDDNSYSRSKLYNGRSMVNVNSHRDIEPSPPLENGYNSTHVLRSHSLNVKPATNLSSLRSPNLIASIARTNSTRRIDSQSTEDLLSKNLYQGENRTFNRTESADAEPNTEEKRSRFMEGLLSTAPELFHFIHGEGEDTVDNKKRSDSPPRLVRPPGSSSPSPAPVNPPKVFTFGRSDNGGGTLQRGSSGSRQELNSSTTNINKPSYSTNSMGRNSSGYDSGSYTNSMKRNGLTDHGNRRQSAFNMKTEGSSLLYSPSFRERSLMMKKDRQQIREDAEMAGKRGNLVSGLHRDNAPILLQVNNRDWNAR